MNNIKNGENSSTIIDTSTNKKLFDSQQFMLEMTVHSGDLSVGARPFHIVKTWKLLLFDEFFSQGDLEIAQDLPISFLCDRKTTKVCEKNDFFVKFICLPLIKSMSEILPEADELA